MAPRHQSRFSRSREPFSSTPPRQKFDFPLVNTPVRRSRENCENLPPGNSLTLKPHTSPFSDVKPSPSLAKSSSKHKAASVSSSSLPPRNASHRPSPVSVNATSTISNANNLGIARRKLSLETPNPPAEDPPCINDNGVNVIVRIRPSNPKEVSEEAVDIVEHLSETSLRLSNHQFVFDQVAGKETTQQGMFEMVGLPFIENCLKGFNSSVFTYGQTGSGKTYTMWGQTEGLIERPMEDRGLAPRIFECLFQRIKEEEAKHKTKQCSYQCRCSFLEIYNEQITDLLEPSQRGLQVREDSKAGVYVENVSEEYVSCVEDVFRLIMKGLANRRVGSTSMNSDSSRSHTVFICFIESRSKSVDGVCCVKTSRMNLVDLAGSERQKATRAAGQRLKEAGNINRSLSQLGNVINILAEMSQTGRPRHVPYRDSRLTFLLHESLGGNAKLAVICTISPMSNCKSETLSTLRFAQRTKAIKNEAMVNEKTENEVESLREQIRQLKDELVRMKNEAPSDADRNSVSAWNARRSYNILRMSLNRPLVLPHTDTDSDEDMEFEDAEDFSNPSSPKAQDELQLSSGKKGRPLQECDDEAGGGEFECRASKKGRLLDGPENASSPTNGGGSIHPNDAETLHCAGDQSQTVVSDAVTIVNQGFSKPTTSEHDTAEDILLPEICNGFENSDMCEWDRARQSVEIKESIQVIGSPSSSLLKDCSLQVPTLSDSPRLKVPKSSSSILHIRIPSVVVPIENEDAPKSEKTQTVHQNVYEDEKNNKIIDSKSLSSPTERLAASLYRGLQILENHQKNIAKSRTSFTSFSIQNLPKSVVDKSVQTSPFASPEKPKTTIVALDGEENGLPKPEVVDIVKCDFGMENLIIPPECNNAEDPKMQQNEECGEPGCEWIATGCESQSLQGHCDTTGNAVVHLDDTGTGQQRREVQELKALLDAAIRRERGVEQTLNQRNAEIKQLNRLVHQYKHERECNAMLQESRELKMSRLQNLMDGSMIPDAFLSEEWSCLLNEHKVLQQKYDQHPEVTLANIAQQRLTEELEQFRQYYDRGERDGLLKEISQLRSQVQCYLELDRQTKEDLDYPEPASAEQEGSSMEQQQIAAMLHELRMQVEYYKDVAEEKMKEMEGERRCANEIKEALEMAMKGHARLLDQFEELQEKHIGLLTKHRKMKEAIADARKKGERKGGCFRGKWIEAQAAELAAVKMEREQERRMAKEQIEGLQAQVRDTAEAVKAAGELLVRLKEAEEARLIAEDVAELAAQDVEKLSREMERLKRKHSTEMATMQHRLMEARFEKANVCPMCLMAERVKFQFAEVGAEEAAAEMEAEGLAAAVEEEEAEEEEWQRGGGDE